MMTQDIDKAGTTAIKFVSEAILDINHFIDISVSFFIVRVTYFNKLGLSPGYLYNNLSEFGGARTQPGRDTTRKKPGDEVIQKK